MGVGDVPFVEVDDDFEAMVKLAQAVLDRVRKDIEDPIELKCSVQNQRTLIRQRGGKFAMTQAETLEWIDSGQGRLSFEQWCVMAQVEPSRMRSKLRKIARRVREAAGEEVAMVT